MTTSIKNVPVRINTSFNNNQVSKFNKEDFKSVLKETLKSASQNVKDNVTTPIKNTFEKREFNNQTTSKQNINNTNSNISSKWKKISIDSVKQFLIVSFKEIVKHPFLAFALVMAIIVTSNISLINKTITLHNIDNLKTEITSIQSKQDIENTYYNEKVNSIELQIQSLQAEIDSIKTEKNNYNETVNNQIQEKKDLLNNNIAKLDLIK